MNSDKRIVMTLDAGGTNFVFSAIRSGAEIVQPVTFPAESGELESCLSNLIRGFETVKALLPEAPAAISFAFPGPADYRHGIIGNLPNFPSFRGGVALGPMLERRFGIPVFINNDGSLFAYGEALTGILPELNQRLAEGGSDKRYHNLLGVTLGTGFGAGVVIDGKLLTGDNDAGGYVWNLRNKRYPGLIVEESVSIRAVRHIYAEQSGDRTDYTPKDIYNIAEGTLAGDRKAAVTAFEELGEMAGDAIATALTLIDGIAVIGGGLSGAAKYIMPALLKEMRGTISMMDGTTFPRMQKEIFDLDNPTELARFIKGDAVTITIPGTDNQISYDPGKRTGIALSKQGANRSIAMGAYTYALNHI